MNQKVTVPELRRRKQSGPKITTLTAYDATFARLFDEAGADVLLVGDTLGMVVQGLSSTLPVTLEEICYHGRMVARGIQRAHLVLDMPFMSFQVSSEKALEAAGRLMKEGAGESVKLEGGVAVAETIARIVAAGIPVMGHVGLTPQSIHAMGGFRVQGKGDDAASRVMEDAKAVQDAGAYAIVLEGLPADLGRQITQALSIPTIGIGAGPDCDGQVLVCYDFLGMFEDFKPKFVKRFAQLGAEIRRATEDYVSEVRSGAFPAEEHCYGVGKPAAETGTPQRPVYGPASDES